MGTYARPYAGAYGGIEPDSPLDASDDVATVVEPAAWSIGDLSPLVWWSAANATVTGEPADDVTAITDAGSLGEDLATDVGTPQLTTPTSLGSRTSVSYTDDILTAFTLDQAQPLTIWLVMAFDNIAGNDGWFLYTGGGTITMRVAAGTPNSLHVGTDGSFGTAVDTFAPADDTSYLITFYCNGTSSQLWVNGTEYSVNTTGWGSGNLGSTNVGGRSSNMADCSIAELVVTSGAPSAGDISSFNAWRAANAA